MTRICAKCRIEKAIDDFYTTKAGNPYAECKKCHHLRIASYRKKPEYQERERKHRLTPEARERTRINMKKHRAERMSDDLKGYKMDSMLKSAKRRAKKTGLEFHITEADFQGWRDLTHCPILGIEFRWDNPNTSEKRSSPTIDRIDSTKGYIPGNVMLISYRANTVKNSGTAEEHRKIADFMDNLHE